MPLLSKYYCEVTRSPHSIYVVVTNKENLSILVSSVFLDIQSAPKLMCYQKLGAALLNIWARKLNSAAILCLHKQSQMLQS